MIWRGRGGFARPPRQHEPSSLRGVLSYTHATHTGRVRDHNEDRLACDAEAGLLVLADGMGGYNAGEIASEIAVRTVLQLTSRSCAGQPRGHPDGLTGLMLQSIALRDAIVRANKLIRNTAARQPECAGMGTTLVACLFWDNRVSIAHLGDSRLYRLRDGQLQQLTEDHSLLQEMSRGGMLSRGNAPLEADRHCITRALGVSDTVEVELREEPVRPGDLYLLCSDGLTDMVPDGQLGEILLRRGNELEQAGKELIRLGNHNGGRDNLSLILARIAAPFPA